MPNVNPLTPRLPPPFLALDNKTTKRQVFKTTTLPTCLPPKTQRPKDGYFEKYFLRKSENLSYKCAQAGGGFELPRSPTLQAQL